MIQVFSGCLLAAFFVLQRLLQYFTSSQQRSHFLRQVKGRWQTGQILVGRSDFLVFDLDILGYCRFEFDLVKSTKDKIS